MVNLKKATFAALTALISFSYALPEPVLVNLNTLGSGVVVVGGLYRPDDTTTAEAAIAVFVMHTAADYIAFPACTQLAARGYTVLCADDPASLYSAQQADIDLEGTLLSVAVGVEYLQSLTEINKVVLFGHSGGGGVMSAYQNIAENGLAACNGSEKLLPCPTTLADLTPADGVMLIDPVYGISTQVLLSMGAEIIDETNGMERNASLSVYNTANGFNATGSSKYTTEFTKAFMSAVAKRMQRVVKYSQERIAAIDNGTGSFIDDEDLYIPDADYGQQNNKLYPQDTGFLSRTVHAWPLLHANESITTSVIHTVRVATNFGPSEAASYTNGALKTSVRRFLGAFAMTVTDDFGYNATSFTGIQWNSSHMVPNEAVRGIKSPLLTMGMTGYWLFPNCEMIYLNSGSNDTSIVFVEGAQHNIDTCTACETYSDQYGNTTKTAYDYMASWLGKEGRFL